MVIIYEVTKTVEMAPPKGKPKPLVCAMHCKAHPNGGSK